MTNVCNLFLQPAPEQIVGKEKKRKKLDEIVLGLSAAKASGPSASPTEPARSRAASILPDVTVTPAALSSSAQALSTQKPFSVTLTNVPSPQTSKESFLQQSLEQSVKSQKTSVPSAIPGKSYSHEAKVNKWLAEQAASVDTRRRSLAPVLAPDERVPVVHRVTGKRITGHKAPQLKHLAQWIAENPMYDIDTKWTESIKELVKLPQDVRSQRHSPMQSTSTMGERKKGRPPTLDAASANVLSSSSHLNQNLAGLNPALLASLSSLNAFDTKTLAATLSNFGFDQKLLNTFDPKLLSSLGSFDPKNNPLLSSFASMPNLLGNMTGGNLFANLAGLGLPGFSSLDMNALSGAATSTADSKSKSRKPTDSGSSATSKSTNSQFPFVFTNPNMLYPQLGLSGLNPFGMHTGMSSAYDALGLLSNNLAASSSATSLHSSSHSSSRTSTKTTTPRSSTVVTNSATSRQQKVSDRQQTSQLPQILLPPDPYLLESLSKQSLNYDALLRADKKNRESEGHEATATDLSKVDKKKQQYDALRTHVPPEFAAVQEKLLKGDKKDIDISKMLLEQMASGALSASLVSSAEAKRAKDIDKDSFDKLNKPSAEYVTRTLSTDDGAAAISLTHKRGHDEMTNEPENLALQSTDLNPAKKVKETSLSEGIPNLEKRSDHATHTGEMDLEDLIAPSTVIKTGMKSSDFENNVPKMASNDNTPSQVNVEREEKVHALNPFDDSNMPSVNDNGQNTDSIGNKADGDNNGNGPLNDEGHSNDTGRRGNRKKGRKSSEESVPSGPRRELRSSSGRQSTETQH